VRSLGVTDNGSSSSRQRHALSVDDGHVRRKGNRQVWPDAGLYRTQPSQHRPCEHAGTNRSREALPLLLQAEVHGALRRSAATISLQWHAPPLRAQQSHARFLGAHATGRSRASTATGSASLLPLRTVRLVFSTFLAASRRLHPRARTHLQGMNPPRNASISRPRPVSGYSIEYR
jgi:hypothetical protein